MKKLFFKNKLISTMVLIPLILLCASIFSTLESKYHLLGNVDYNNPFLDVSPLLPNSNVLAESNSKNEQQMLARAINGEARGEPYVGQVAVGAVILNRVRDSRFPKTISGVIYQSGAFTAVSDGQINVPLEEDSTVLKAAMDALNGWDPSSGCVYYWNPNTATSKWIWTRKIMTSIGKHNFAK